MMPRLRSRTAIERRLRAQIAGHRGEAWAALFLQLKLYRLRDRNYKTPVGELDLVVEKGNTLVFVEVKLRARRDEEAVALEAVNQRRITRAAEYWLMRHPRESAKDCRFDVIFLAPGRWPRHLVDAFPAAE